MLECYYFIMSLVYQEVENRADNDSEGFISRKVAPSSIFQVINVIKMISQL
jgi:hypothetical protein